MANQSPAAKEKLVKAVVRRGTIYTDTVTAKAWDHALQKEVDVVKAAGEKGVGEMVELPAVEVERLTRLGFLASPDETAPAAQEGDASMLKLLDRSEVGFAQKAI